MTKPITDAVTALRIADEISNRAERHCTIADCENCPCKGEDLCTFKIFTYITVEVLSGFQFKRKEK